MIMARREFSAHFPDGPARLNDAFRSRRELIVGGGTVKLPKHCVCREAARAHVRWRRGRTRCVVRSQWRPWHAVIPVGGGGGTSPMLPTASRRNTESPVFYRIATRRTTAERRVAVTFDGASLFFFFFLPRFRPVAGLIYVIGR